jgi:hypothetical protein
MNLGKPEKRLTVEPVTEPEPVAAPEAAPEEPASIEADRSS